MEGAGGGGGALRNTNSVKDELFARMRLAHPEASQEDFAYYEDVMSLDQDKFKLYAEKLGIEGDIDDLTNRYFSEHKEATRTQAMQRWNDEKARSLHRPGGTTANQFASEKNDQRWSRVRPESADELIENLRNRGIGFDDRVGTDPERLRRELSQIVNILDDDDQDILNITRDHVKTVSYMPDRKPGDTASAAYDVARKSLDVYPHRGFDLPSGAWVHEIGHAAEEYGAGMVDLQSRGFGDGHIASMYGNGNPSEDFAETFLAVKGGAWKTKEIKDWMPSKYQYVLDLLKGVQ